MLGSLKLRDRYIYARIGSDIQDMTYHCFTSGDEAKFHFDLLKSGVYDFYERQGRRQYVIPPVVRSISQPPPSYDQQAYDIFRN